MTPRPSQSGSAFFIILFGIALFGLLSYAVMQGGQGNMSQLSDDQAKLAAQEIISYSDTVATGFQKLKLKGCTENQLSIFHTKEFSIPGYYNSSAPPDKSCDLYSSNGGYITAIHPPDNWFAMNAGLNAYWAYNTKNSIVNIGTASEELTFNLINVKKEICIKINDILGVGVKGGNPPEIPNFADAQEFKGVFVGGGLLNNSNINSKIAFCIKEPSDGFYKYVRVVLAR